MKKVNKKIKSQDRILRTVLFFMLYFIYSQVFTSLFGSSILVNFIADLVFLVAIVFAYRDNLKEVFLLIDFRHKPTNDDLLMYNFLKYYNLNITIIATKVDKIGKTLREKQEKLIKDTLGITENDNFILFSSSTKLGKSSVTNIISKIVYGEEE